MKNSLGYKQGSATRRVIVSSNAWSRQSRDSGQGKGHNIVKDRQLLSRPCNRVQLSATIAVAMATAGHVCSRDATDLFAAEVEGVAADGAHFAWMGGRGRLGGVAG
jgi:hypothetical protein